MVFLTCPARVRAYEKKEDMLQMEDKKIVNGTPECFTNKQILLVSCPVGHKRSTSSAH